MATLARYPRISIKLLVLLNRAKKHYSFSAGIPAMQVCLLIQHLLRYLVQYLQHFHSTPYWEVHSDVNSHALPAALIYQCTFLVESHNQYTLLPCGPAWDPHVLFWAVPLPPNEVFSNDAMSPVMYSAPFSTYTTLGRSPSL